MAERFGFVCSLFGTYFRVYSLPTIFITVFNVSFFSPLLSMFLEEGMLPFLGRAVARASISRFVCPSGVRPSVIVSF